MSDVITTNLGSLSAAGQGYPVKSKSSGAHTLVVTLSGSGALSFTGALMGSNNNESWAQVTQLVLAGNAVAVSSPRVSGDYAYWRLDAAALAGTNAVVSGVLSTDASSSFAGEPIAILRAADGSIGIPGDGPGAMRIGSSGIVGARKIRRMLSAIGQSAFRRVNIGYHSHSIGAGVDVTEAGTFGSAQWEAWHTRSQAAIIAKILSASTGGVSCSANIATGGTGGTRNPLLTLGGSTGGTPGIATAAADALFGPASWRAVLPGVDGTGTISFKAVGTSVRVYGVCSGISGFGQMRWRAPSVSGGATQTVSAPSAAPTPENNRNWYDFTISPVVPGETVTLMDPTSGSYGVFYIDLDYRPDIPGVTVHRLCQPGASLSALHAAALDNGDTAGTGAWLGSGNANKRLGQAQSMSVRVPQDGVILQTDVNDLNDYIDRGFSLADMRRHLRNYLNYQASLNIDVLAVFGPIRDPAFNVGSRPYDQDALIAAYAEEISGISNAAYLDLTKEWPGVTLAERWTAQVASGVMEPVPLVHPGAMGHGYYGAWIGNAIVQASYSGKR